MKLALSEIKINQHINREVKMLKSHQYSILLCVAVSISTLAGISDALGQTKTLDRDLFLASVTGSALQEFAGAPITEASNELFLYSYDGGAQAWRQIPFQFDEVGTMVIEGDTMSLTLFPDDGMLDEDDILVFVIRDAGDRADNSWIDNEASKAFSRYELEISDSVEPSKKAWVYLYRSNTDAIPSNQIDYVDYIPGPEGTPAADTVVGHNYKIANGENGLANFLSIPAEAGGTAIDILDSQQLEIKTSLGLSLNETDNFRTKDVHVIDGRVRVTRWLTVDILLGIIPFVEDLLIPALYDLNSYTLPINIEIPETLPLGITITELRTSFNLNENSSGMEFFNVNNSNVPVDGVPDNIDDTAILFPAGRNRLLFKGSQGTLVNTFNVPVLGDMQRLFYEDDADSASYGNAGLIIQGADIQGPAPLVLSMLFPGPVSSGEESVFTDPTLFELEVESSAQSHDAVTSVEGEIGLPESFELMQNYPNPFNPATTLKYSMPEQARITIKVYDLLGKEVVTLVDNELKQAGFHVTAWDGRNTIGNVVASGMYFVKMQIGNFVQTRKMVFVQ